jgi:hypothetical protein
MFEMRLLMDPSENCSVPCGSYLSRISSQMLIYTILFTDFIFRLYKTESVIANASDILIVPTENNGQGAICALEKGFQDSTFFLFQKKKFVWDSDKKIFKKLEYLHHQGHPFSFFTKSHLGLKNQDISNELGLKFGKNTFDVPIPSFMSLFKEHLVAPFFVFQIFCVCLWFLVFFVFDESIVTTWIFVG